MSTFVNAAPLLTMLTTPDHQIIYGRRGTGKTHAFLYTADQFQGAGDVAIYIDLRSAGSNTSIYSDASRSLSERATSLLLDVLQFIHEALYTTAIEMSEELDLSQIGPLLDAFHDSISEVAVVGTVEQERSTMATSGREDSSGAGLTIGTSGVGARLDAHSADRETEQQGQRTTQTGTAYHRVQFGSVMRYLSELITGLGEKRVWIFLDEWSVVPLDLQPYLADLLRRSLFPIQKLTVKIAAIEQRTLFQLSAGNGEYIGIELGADAAANLNLDDFMVFDNDPDRAKNFFRDLLFKHYRATDGLPEGQGSTSGQDLIRQAFTQISAFEEYVRAVEGVPRDAINIVAMAAQKAYGSAISVSDIRSAARDWYQRDKSTVMRSNLDAADLLNWITDEVISHRRARAFLLRSDQRDNLIDALFDARLLHILKRNISAHDQPGVRYDVYKLDYGCYVDLITTQRAPQGLLPYENSDGGNQFVEVPPDDYRSIRRAILNLDDFYRARPSEGGTLL